MVSATGAAGAVEAQSQRDPSTVKIRNEHMAKYLSDMKEERKYDVLKLERRNESTQPSVVRERPL